MNIPKKFAYRSVPANTLRGMSAGYIDRHYHIVSMTDDNRIYTACGKVLAMTRNNMTGIRPRHFKLCPRCLTKLISTYFTM
jgi:hypothetical protein